MASSSLRCVIAAGGTAGHVMPSLAVGEALRARGVSVSFAGSPDRIEAQLVNADAGRRLQRPIQEGERVVSSANFLIDAESKVQGALKDFEDKNETAKRREGETGREQ